MTNLSRITGKIFGETATATGADPEIGQFGSGLAGTYVGTGDVATIQSLPAWSNGFIDSVTPSTQFPPLPEMTGFGKVLSYQNAYLMQKGVAEWDSGTTYYTGDFAKGVGEGKLYVSKVDNNLNHAVTDGTYWDEFTSGGASRNIGEIVTSTIPLTDAGLHLLDGTLISGSGSYSAFVDYIADLYDSGDYPDLFDTEANWQAAVTQYGVCGKFVYDSVNNTVRLPKWGNQIFTKSPTGTIPVKGNGTVLGITDGTNNAGIRHDISSNASYLRTNINAYNEPVGSATYTASFLGNNTNVGLTTDGTKSGIVADISSITNYPLDCYYYIVIATSTKTVIQVDIDEIATDLNGKADTDLSNVTNTSGFRKLVELYNNGASWYKVFREYDPSTGNLIGLWCEQGGAATGNGSSGKTVTLLKEYSSTSYSVVVTITDYSSGNQKMVSIGSRTTSNFKAYTGSTTSWGSYDFSWQASGYMN